MAQDRATITASETIHVARSPADVFDFTQDYATRSSWDRSIVEAEVLSVSPRRVRVRVRGVGRFTIEYRLFRRGERTSAAFVDADSFLVTGGGGSWAYEPAGDGTDWTQTNTLELRHPRLLGWLGPLVERNLRKGMRQAMESAKRLMETGGASTPIS